MAPGKVKFLSYINNRDFRVDLDFPKGNDDD